MSYEDDKTTASLYASELTLVYGMRTRLDLKEFEAVASRVILAAIVEAQKRAKEAGK